VRKGGKRKKNRGRGEFEKRARQKRELEGSLLIDQYGATHFQSRFEDSQGNALNPKP
jgi:hypothetical protein